MFQFLSFLPFKSNSSIILHWTKDIIFRWMSEKLVEKLDEEKKARLKTEEQTSLMLLNQEKTIKVMVKWTKVMFSFCWTLFLILIRKVNGITKLIKCREVNRQALLPYPWISLLWNRITLSFDLNYIFEKTHFIKEWVSVEWINELFNDDEDGIEIKWWKMDELFINLKKWMNKFEASQFMFLLCINPIYYQLTLFKKKLILFWWELFWANCNLFFPIWIIAKK